MLQNQALLSFVLTNVIWTIRSIFKCLIIVITFLLPLSVRIMQGVLLDSHLSWKYHIDNVALKITRIIGVIARLRHLVPFTTLLSIYRSLILLYLSYGLAAWDQAAKYHLRKILVLQKRALRFLYFCKPRAHAVPLFISSKILPLNMLYVETVSSIVFDV